MSTFEITVYQSDGVSDFCQDAYGEPYRAEERVKTYFEGYNYTGHTISLTKSSKTIGVPTENTKESFEAPYPCDRSFTLQYDSLVYWWKDYVQCELSEARDCDILLTAADGGGGTLNDHYSVAGGGVELAGLPESYQVAGCGSTYSGMWTAMHEAGHALMGEDLSVEEEHNVGYVYDRGSYYHRSPMGHGGDAGENYCGDWSPDHTDDCEEMHWNDDCCVNQWEHTG